MRAARIGLVRPSSSTEAAPAKISPVTASVAYRDVSLTVWIIGRARRRGDRLADAQLVAGSAFG
jgi:hypothetical protein